MRLLIPERPGTIGGPASFKKKLQQGLVEYDIEVVYDRNDEPFDLILVVAGTRHIQWLRSCKSRGIPIVHRLDGFQWYRRNKSITSKSRWIDSVRNKMVQIIRDHLADRVIYQSNFIRDWWHSEQGPARAPETIIYNGVDTDQFSPGDNGRNFNDRVSMLTVEGSLGMHERILRTPVDTWRKLSATKSDASLSLIGELPDNMRGLLPEDPRVRYEGTVPNSDLPGYLRHASAFISAEVNPPCPNSVIESLACGTPVVGFASGALPELVSEQAGVCVDYGGDPWKLEEPDIDGLARAVEEVVANQQAYSEGARQLALEKFGLQRMVSQYVDVFGQALGYSLR